MRVVADITEFLEVGVNHAVHLNELSKKTLLDTNSIKKLIRQARKNGVEILSDYHGYYLSPNKEETKKFIQDLNNQGLERIYTARDLQKNLKIDGQQVLIPDIDNL